MPPRSLEKITKSLVDRLEPGQIIWDREVHGFGVRCQKKSKSYILKTVSRGEQVWTAIGKHGSPWTPDTARREALRLLHEIQNGRDPRRKYPGVAGRVRVSDLCERYLEDHAIPHKKASSVRTDRKNIENHVIPLMGKLFVDDVTRADIEAFQKAVRDGATIKGRPRNYKGGAVVKGGTGVSNRCTALLSKMFNLAEAWELRPQHSNPVRAIKKYREGQKDRFLSSAEFERLGQVLAELERDNAESPFVIAAIRLLMFTGARLGEILSLRWSYVDFDRAILRLPDSKTGAKTIPLNTAALDVLNSVPRMLGNPFVIAGGREGQHLVNLQKPWHRIRTAADLSDVRIHDLRHSFASIALAGGVPLATIGKLLGHKTSLTTQRYAHLADEHLRAAAEAIGAALSQGKKT